MAESLDKKRFLYAYRSLLEEADRQNRPALLLHCCCAPCSSAVLEALSEHFAVSVYYYNPNIEPAEEYHHRLEELDRLRGELPCEIGSVTAPYQPEEFESFARQMADEPEGGRRCARCFALRLEATARAAREAGIPWFATTLTLSPMKDAALLNRIGSAMETKYGVRYLTSDFKKEGGYLYSIRQSEKYHLYRQDYCGCLYSKRESEQRRSSKREG